MFRLPNAIITKLATNRICHVFIFTIFTDICIYSKDN